MKAKVGTILFFLANNLIQHANIMHNFLGKKLTLAYEKTVGNIERYPKNYPTTRNIENYPKIRKSFGNPAITRNLLE